MKSKLRKVVVMVAGVLFFSSFSVAQYSGVEVRLNSGGSLNAKSLYPTAGLPDDVYKGGVKALSFDAIGYYGMSENSSLRLRAGIRRLSFNGESIEYGASSYESTYKTEFGNTSFIIAPGITRNFNMDKLTFIIGTELPIAIIGKTSGEYTHVEKSGGSVTTNDLQKYSIGGGVAVGLNGIAGFRYNIAGSLVLGMELTTGFTYGKVKKSFDTEYYESDVLTSTDTQTLEAGGFLISPIAGALVVGFKF